MYLKHGKKQMLFSALVLVSVDGEHDCLQKRVDLGHGNESAQVSNVPRLGLQKEEQVPVFLRLVVVGECALFHFGSIFEMAGNFILLDILSAGHFRRCGIFTYLLQSHAVLNQQCNTRIKIAHVLLEDEVLLGLRRDLGLEVP
jgi:hypothetical protein